MCIVQSEPAKGRLSRLATASRVLGILSLIISLIYVVLIEDLPEMIYLIVLIGLSPLMLGIASLIAISWNKGALQGKGNAIAGICMGFASLVLIALAVWIVVCGMDRVYMAKDESRAISCLKTIAQQEAVFQQKKEVDQDGNGAGEYGLLGEIADDLALRPSTNRLSSPAYITQQLQTGGNKGKGFAMKSGYYFRIYLSNASSKDLTAVGDDRTLGGDASKGGPPAAAEAIRLQESCFALYAWPAELHSTGSRTFFVNQTGQVYATKMEAKTYDGEDAMPAANAAYIHGCDVFRSPISWGTTPGNDGNQWFPVQ